MNESANTIDLKAYTPQGQSPVCATTRGDSSYRDQRWRIGATRDGVLTRKQDLLRLTLSGTITLDSFVSHFSHTIPPSWAGVTSTSTVAVKRKQVTDWQLASGRDETEQTRGGLRVGIAHWRGGVATKTHFTPSVSFLHSVGNIREGGGWERGGNIEGTGVGRHYLCLRYLEEDISGGTQLI